MTDISYRMFKKMGELLGWVGMRSLYRLKTRWLSLLP